MTIPTRPLTVTINGRRHGPTDVPEGLMMIDVLHEMPYGLAPRLRRGYLPRPVVIWDRDDQSREGDELNHRGALLRWQAHRTIEGIAQRNARGEIETSLDLWPPGQTEARQAPVR